MATKKHPALPFTVSDDGTIIGARGTPLKPRVSNSGYARVVCYLNGKHTSFSVHRLVADCFVDGSGEQVNHKDGDKLNNKAGNLEWCNRSHNVRHAIAAGLIDTKKHNGHQRTVGGKNGRAKVSQEQVLEIRSAYQSGYPRKSQPWKKYGISNAMFRNIIRGDSWRVVK